MILLLGGTSETAGVANALATKGLNVLVSTATDAALDVGRHERIIQRCGPLEIDGLLDLIEQLSITAIVDVTHPYAERIHAVAKKVAAVAGIPHLAYVRPSALQETDDVVLADSHADAAKRAFAFGKTVLLTCGSRNVEPYVHLAREAGVDVFARILNCSESLQA